MPYLTPKSSDVWFNLPGVVAAYQPIAAPDFIAARQNVSSNFGRLGQYTTTPGTAPTWSPASGWTFNGTTQYLTTGIAPTQAYSVIVQFSNRSGAGADQCVIGERETNTKVFNLLWESPNWYFQIADMTGSKTKTTPSFDAGNLCIAGTGCYKNGLSVATLASATFSSSFGFYIGAAQISAGTASFFYGGNIQSVLITSRILSPAEVWQASQQMKYCEVNPDWNAWGRRRKWFIVAAPSAGAVGIYGARATIALPGGVSIRPTGGNT